MDGRDISRITRNLGRLQSYQITYFGKHYYITPKYHNLFRTFDYSRNPIYPLIKEIDFQIFKFKLRNLEIPVDSEVYSSGAIFLDQLPPRFLNYVTTNVTPNTTPFTQVIENDNLLHYLQTQPARRRFARHQTLYHFSQDLFSIVFPTGLRTDREERTRGKCEYCCRWFFQNCKWHEGLNDQELIARRKQFTVEFKGYREDVDFWHSLVMDVCNDWNRTKGAKYNEKHVKTFEFLKEWMSRTEGSEQYDWQQYAQGEGDVVHQCHWCGSTFPSSEELTKHALTCKDQSRQEEEPKTLQGFARKHILDMLDAVSSLNDALPKFVEKYQTALVSIVLAMINMVIIPDWKNVVMMIAIITNELLSLTSRRVTDLIARLAESFEKVMLKFFPKAQAAPTRDEDYKAYNESFITSIFELLGTLLPWTKNVEPGILKARLEKIKNSAAVLNHAKSMVDFIVTFLYNIWKWVQIWWRGGTYEDYKKALDLLEHDEVEKWIKEVTDFEMQPLEDGTIRSGVSMLVSDEKARQTVIDLKKHGEEILMKLNNLGGEHNLKLTKNVNFCLNKVNKWFSSFESNLGVSKKKHEPFVLHLFGGAGVGKSFMMNYILQHLCWLLEGRKDFDPSKDTFSKPRTSPYYTGYHNQFAFIADDIFQINDANEKIADCGFLIDACSRTEMHLNMAEVANKGNAYFQSKVILMTSNSPMTEGFVGNTVDEFSAIARRIDLSVQVFKVGERNPHVQFDTDSLAFTASKYVQSVDGKSGEWEQAGQAKMNWDMFITMVGINALAKKSAQERLDVMKPVDDDYRARIMRLYDSMQDKSPWGATKEFSHHWTSPDIEEWKLTQFGHIRTMRKEGDTRQMDPASGKKVKITPCAYNVTPLPTDEQIIQKASVVKACVALDSHENMFSYDRIKNRQDVEQKDEQNKLQMEVKYTKVNPVPHDMTKYPYSNQVDTAQQTRPPFPHEHEPSFKVSVHGSERRVRAMSLSSDSTTASTKIHTDSEPLQPAQLLEQVEKVNRVPKTPGTQLEEGAGPLRSTTLQESTKQEAVVGPSNAQRQVMLATQYVEKKKQQPQRTEGSQSQGKRKPRKKQQRAQAEEIEEVQQQPIEIPVELAVGAPQVLESDSFVDAANVEQMSRVSAMEFHEEQTHKLIQDVESHLDRIDDGIERAQEEIRDMEVPSLDTSISQSQEELYDPPKLLDVSHEGLVEIETWTKCEAKLFKGEATGAGNMCFYDTIAQLIPERFKDRFDVRSQCQRGYKIDHPFLYWWEDPYTDGKMVDDKGVREACRMFNINLCVHTSCDQVPEVGVQRYIYNSKSPMYHIHHEALHFEPLFDHQVSKEMVKCPACIMEFQKTAPEDLFRHDLEAVHREGPEGIHTRMKDKIAMILLDAPVRKFPPKLTESEEKMRVKLFEDSFDVPGAAMSWMSTRSIIYSRPEYIRAYLEHYEQYVRPSILSKAIAPVRALQTPVVWAKNKTVSFMDTVTDVVVKKVLGCLVPNDVKNNVKAAVSKVKDTIDSFKLWSVLGVVGVFGAVTLTVVLNRMSSNKCHCSEGIKVSAPLVTSARKKKQRKVECEDQEEDELELPEVTYRAPFVIQNVSPYFKWRRVGMTDNADVTISSTNPKSSNYRVEFSNSFPLEPMEFTKHVRSEEIAARLEPFFKHSSEGKEERMEKVAELIHTYPVEAEASRDLTASEVMKRIAFNQCIVRNYQSGVALAGLFLREKILVLPAHILGRQQLEDKVVIGVLTHNTTQAVQFQLTTSNTYCLEHKDLLFVNMADSTFSCFPDITKKFIKQEDDVPVLDGYLTIPKVGSSGRIEFVVQKQMGRIAPLDRVDYIDAKTGIHYNTARGFTYTGDTEAGECGSVLIRMDPRQDRKLLGIHVAGGVGVGTALSLTQEGIQEALKNFQETAQGCDVPLATMSNIEEFFETTLVEDEEEFFDCLPYVTYLGDVDPSCVPYQSNKTKLEPSEIHGKLIAPKSKPAKQCPFKDEKGRVIDPHKIALSKLESPLIQFDQSLVDAAALRMASDYAQKGQMDYYNPDEKNGKLSEEEVIRGVEGDKWIRPLNMHTSPGYPYVMGGSKQDFLDYETGQYGDILAAAIHQREEAAKRGEAKPAVIVDVMKDERLPSKKVDAGKIRIFNVCPLDYNLLVRKYFTRFLAQMMQHHIMGDVSVGLNPHSAEWELLYRRLQSRGHHWIAGDYSAWDKRMPIQIARAVLVVIETFYRQFQDYSEEDAKVREVLVEQAYTSVRMSVRGNKGFLYQVHQSFPSGIAVTAVYNSLLNALLFRVIFAELAIESGLSKVYAINRYDELVSFAAYGDDHLARVSDTVFGWFNMITISKQMAKHSITYTSATKEDVAMPGVPDEELQYLKRKFVSVNGRFNAPMDLEAILDISNWVQCSRPSDKKEATESAVRSMLVELTHHPKSVWDEWFPKIFRVCLEARYDCPILSYQDALQRRLEVEMYEDQDQFLW